MLTRRLGRWAVALAVLPALALPAVLATAAGAAGTTPTIPGVKASNVGLTVSWLSTTDPVPATPGGTATSQFYVTNQTDAAVPVHVYPATAVPADDGKLTVKSGADPRFPNITYNPSVFTAEPKTTTTVSVTVTVPKNLAPGVYIVPGVVRPDATSDGNLQFVSEIDALTTFSVAGSSAGGVTPSFVGSSEGSPSLHIPGLPAIQIATSGHEVLRVMSTGASLLAYNEITATQSPFGHVVFQGHTAGDPSDLRNPLALYFPGHYRDFPLAWQPSSAGIGLAHLQAYVGYHATPQVIRQVGASTEVLVVAPWWLAALVVYEAVLWLWSRRKLHRIAVRRSRANAPVLGHWYTRPLPIIGSAVMVLLVVAEAFLSSIGVFAAVGAVGVVAAAVVVGGSRGADDARALGRVRRFEGATAVVVVAGLVAVALGAFSAWSTQLSMAVVAGAGVWVLLAWWLAWWFGSRPFTASPPDAEPPLPEREVVAVGG